MYDERSARLTSGVAAGRWRPVRSAFLWVVLACPTAWADVWDVGPLINGSHFTDNSMVFTPNLLVHGGVQVHDLAALSTNETCPTPPCPDRDWYLVLTPPYSSHEVLVEGVTSSLMWRSSGGGAVADPPAVSRHDGAGTLLQLGEIIGYSIVTSATTTLRWETGASSVETADYVAVAAVQPPACDNLCDATAQYTIRLYETTVAVPRFNNTNCQVTVLILQNTAFGNPQGATNRIDGHINFFSNTAPGQPPPVQVPFTLFQGENLVLDSSTVPGLASVAGKILISHTGRYGQLAGKATALEPATGFTFDTPLVTMPR
jgi:hypothetical protein